MSWLYWSQPEALDLPYKEISHAHAIPRGRYNRCIFFVGWNCPDSRSKLHKLNARYVYDVCLSYLSYAIGKTYYIWFDNIICDNFSSFHTAKIRKNIDAANTFIVFSCSYQFYLTYFMVPLILTWIIHGNNLCLRRNMNSHE